MNMRVFELASILCISLFIAGCSEIFVPVKAGSNPKAESKKGKNENDVSPSGLAKSPVNPIAPAQARRTSVSRPKIVMVQDMTEGDASKRKYFDVVDKTRELDNEPAEDESARPIRIVTYDNNAIQKSYPMEFGKAWRRALEAMLEMPLNTVDKSSGVITTEWVYDKAKGSNDILSFAMLGSKTASVRYKYTVRILDGGSFTAIKVVPFAQVRKAQQWDTALPNIVVTKKMFERIELELRTPLANGGF